MRVKVFSAHSMSDALELVRKELGNDALIIDTQRLSGDVVRVTAGFNESANSDDDVREALEGQVDTEHTQSIRDSLVYHNVTDPLLEKILIATRTVDTRDPRMACAAAFDQVFRFASLPLAKTSWAFMLVGAPGCGKTTTVAKLATNAIMKHLKPGVITTDTVRAGAVDQLRSFANILEIPFLKAATPVELSEAIESMRRTCDLIYVDTPSCNPFNDEEVANLSSFIDAGGIEVVLVMPAGLDSSEAIEMGEVFNRLGAGYMIVTKLDVCRRMGGILWTAYANDLSFSEVGIGGSIPSGLVSINPVSMARLILPANDDIRVGDEHE